MQLGVCGQRPSVFVFEPAAVFCRSRAAEVCQSAATSAAAASWEQRACTPMSRRPRLLGLGAAPKVNSAPSTPTLTLLSRTSLHAELTARKHNIALPASHQQVINALRPEAVQGYLYQPARAHSSHREQWKVQVKLLLYSRKIEVPTRWEGSLPATCVTRGVGTADCARPERHSAMAGSCAGAGPANSMTRHHIT